MTETIKEFSDFPAAFQYCYRCSCIVRVMINGELWQICPSGLGEKVKGDGVPGDKEDR